MEVFKGQPETTFQLRAQAGRDMAHNEKIVEKRVQNLNKEGAFRVAAKAKAKAFARAADARYGGEVHQIAAVHAGHVTDTQGNSFQTKLVRAVPVNSLPVEDTKITSTKRGLQKFRARLRRFLRTERSLPEVREFLQGLEGFAVSSRGMGIVPAIQALGATVRGNRVLSMAASSSS